MTNHMNTGKSPNRTSASRKDNRFFAPMLVGFVLATARIQAAPAEGVMPNPAGAEALRAAARGGSIAFRLSTPDELEPFLGKPANQQSRKEGDFMVQILEFPGVKATFARVGELASPFTLFELQIEGQAVDIGRDRQIVLRTVDDLRKLDAFWGLAGVSLAKLDLREQLKALNRFSFDTRTVWPAAAKLPAGFAPAQLLEEGKNPGLGVRKLHAARIDGKGVGIAIIDQPLLRGHEEYKDRIVKYTEVDVQGAEPQMHGPSVASIAVGKKCGVAPGAAVYYFAVPTWKWLRNEPWAEQLERIIALNRELKDTPKIRVVSISLGAFSERPNHARWQEAVKKAEENGILVVTCDPQFLRLASLKRVEGRPDAAATDYVRGLFGQPGAVLCVPAANRTLASYRGPRFYTYDRLGGMSWTVPYLAGVAALGFQIDPSLKAGDMVELWKRTAVKTAAGPVIDPAGLVEAIKAQSNNG